MIKAAITGNIACGKTQVENILLQLGYTVIDTDKINHKLFENDEVLKEIKSVFGNDVFDISGKISRQKLGEIVFSSKNKKQKLENIMHPKILEAINKFFETNKNEKIVFVSIPLLFEVNWQNKFDKIIFISADEKIRLKRLISRNNFSEEYAIKRINAQEKEQEKIKQSDFIIYNNSDLENLEKKVKDVIQKLKNYI